MGDLTLVIGNKNYSSWSLRPWLVLKVAGIPFREHRVLLDLPDSAAKIREWSPSGRVPVLADGDLRIWDSLAINEYLAETFPDKTLWPSEKGLRASARAISAEMHSGFTALRSNLLMDTRSRRTKTWGADVQADIDRICQIWRDARARVPAGGGPFLFGRFSIADAMYAPVATRFRTYGVQADAVCTTYRDTILDLPAMKAWDAEAAQEPVMQRYAV